MSLTSVEIRDAVVRSCVRYRKLLEHYHASIDRLNVFPVPDGDTGTNMLLTVRSVTDAVERMDLSSQSLAEVFSGLAMAALLGARGNSGVILSQLLQGFTSELTRTFDNGSEQVALSCALASALTTAAELASAAVLRPMEGTILTVARSTAEAAVKACSEGESGDLDAFFRATLLAARRALEITPRQLEQLQRAGVVDSGGAGYVHFIESLWGGFCGASFDAEGQSYPWFEGTEYLGGPIVATRWEDSGEALPVEELRYEVMFLLRSDSDAKVDAMKEVWLGLGDSIVVVGQEGTWNCHVHTNQIGAVIEAGIAAGELRTISVTDLRDQVEEENWVRSGRSAGVGSGPRDQALTEVVTVSDGEGIARIFYSLGVRHNVPGGPSMNPSTSDLLTMIENCDAENVLVLPNNSNVVAAATAAVQLTTKTVEIVRTSSVIEGFSALMVYDPASPLADNVDNMLKAVARVSVGEVTVAVRSGEGVSGGFQAGDFIGLSTNGVEVSGDDLATVTKHLLDVMITETSEIVTIVEGENVVTASSRKLVALIESDYPHLVVDIHHGGQALYPYLLGVE
jgi:DAK2 domain fusion protein YloV